jgi:putative SOS response-associated peptidase YedK
MCSRFVSPNELAFAAYLRRLPKRPLRRPQPPLSARYNVAPTTEVAVLRAASRARELLAMRWGLIPFFDYGVPGPLSSINVRVDTLRTAPAYRGAWKRGQRCVVLAQGFYEWQVLPDGKQPWYIACANQPVFGFAGLWDSSTPDVGEDILSCTIITLPASPLMAKIHSTQRREPAILRAADTETWLTGTEEEAFACLNSYPDELRTAWRVSTQVNSPDCDGPQLIEPIAA